MIIRNATVDDAEAILKIYEPYVLDTAISFEYDVPSMEEMRNRIKKTLDKYPYLVAELEGQVVGYCYVGVFHDRKAYDECVETSIYISAEYKKMGIGKQLYDNLEKKLKAQGITHLYACIAYPEEEDEYVGFDSVYFHEKMGYELCGHFHNCGFKFGRYIDMIYMEKII